MADIDPTLLKKARDLISQGNLILHDLPFDQVMKAVKSSTLQLYNVIRIPLTGAQNDFELQQSGRFFYVYRIIDSTGADVSGTLNVKFNRNSERSIPVVAGQGVVTPFDRIFVTNAATAGAIAEIIISEDFDLFRIIDNRLATAISTISSIGSITGEQNALTQVPTAATQVKARLRSASGVNDEVIYTVTAGKTLNLQFCQIWCDNTATRQAEILVTNAADAIQYTVLASGLNNGSGSFFQRAESPNFLPQLEIPAGFKLKIKKRDNTDADQNNFPAWATITGWEI